MAKETLDEATEIQLRIDPAAEHRRRNEAENRIDIRVGGPVCCHRTKTYPLHVSRFRDLWVMQDR